MKETMLSNCLKETAFRTIGNYPTLLRTFLKRKSVSWKNTLIYLLLLFLKKQTTLKPITDSLASQSKSVPPIQSSRNQEAR